MINIKRKRNIEGEGEAWHLARASLGKNQGEEAKREAEEGGGQGRGGSGRGLSGALARSDGRGGEEKGWEQWERRRGGRSRRGGGLSVVKGPIEEVYDIKFFALDLHKNTR